jgi:hypothetical protein
MDRLELRSITKCTSSLESRGLIIAEIRKHAYKQKHLGKRGQSLAQTFKTDERPHRKDSSVKDFYNSELVLTNHKISE